MQFYSLNNQSPKVSFKEAVVRGIAPDRGLYFPEKITPLPDDFFENITALSEHEIAFKAVKQFVGDTLSDLELQQIIKEVLDFNLPVVSIDTNLATLELFHGPTMAFKDVGARFMARCLGSFSKNENKKITVLVATSGDTGGAVANGFLGVSGVEVVILYPSGKVSEIQEKQLTTLGQNISALEVNGTFDDCQRMVKTAFVDADLQNQMQLTSANSINIARWLPQMFYFLFAYKQIQHLNKKVVFAVPSGNFGNICAGMMAQKLGMPVHHFIAATNCNDTVPQFMKHGTYTPKPSKATISNAMDVGDPSNFIRIRELYGNDFDRLSEQLTSYSFSDVATKSALKSLYENNGYVADPHGAVGYLGLKKYQQQYPDTYGIFLETAHPVKFLDTVEEVIGEKLEIPIQIQKILPLQKVSKKISSYEDLKSYLLLDLS